MQPLPGTYGLVLISSIEKPIKIGTIFLKPGFYAYIGSAFGPGGLKARISHHLNNPSRPHWHIDYLGPALSLGEIWYTYDPLRREHQWVEVHAATRGATIPIPGFGSSDCGCLSHLFFYRTLPSATLFRRKVHARFLEHDRIMIEKPFKQQKSY